MHWIQTIRENLKLTQHELAGYLQLSVHTIQSMEQGRRELPFKSMRACIALYNAMKAGKACPANDPSPEADPRKQRQLKALHRRCCHRLVLCREKLQKVQEDYENACQTLHAYQLLADALTPSHSPEDIVRLKWLEWQTAETLHRIRENNATAQGLLRAEIAALEGRTKALESMLVSDIDQKSESAAFCQEDTDDGGSLKEQTLLNGSTKTLQPRYLHRHEPLTRVEPETVEDHHVNGEVKRVNRAGPDPDPGRSGFMRSISQEALDDSPGNSHHIANNEGEVATPRLIRIVGIVLQNRSAWHCRVGEKNGLTEVVHKESASPIARFSKQNRDWMTRVGGLNNGIGKA